MAAVFSRLSGSLHHTRSRPKTWMWYKRALKAEYKHIEGHSSVENMKMSSDTVKDSFLWMFFRRRLVPAGVWGSDLNSSPPTWRTAWASAHTHLYRYTAHSLKDGANRSSLGWSVCWRSWSGTQCIWNPSLESHHKLCPVRKCCLKMRRKKSCGWLKVCRGHAGRKIHFRSSFYCREAETVKAAGSLLHQCSQISEKWSVKQCDLFIDQ